MQISGRKSYTTQISKYLADNIVACRKKGGQWDRDVGICVLQDNKISTREEAIENAVYRICDTKYNFEEYPDIIGCFKQEGFARIRKMKNHPHQPSFLEPKIIKTFMSETLLGDSENCKNQYRYPGWNGWVHARECNDYGLIHADKHKPTNIVQHLGEYIEYKVFEKN